MKYNWTYIITSFTFLVLSAVAYPIDKYIATSMLVIALIDGYVGAAFWSATKNKDIAALSKKTKNAVRFTYVVGILLMLYVGYAISIYIPILALTTYLGMKIYIKHLKKNHK